MAHCKLAPQEFIQNAFAPMIASMSSPLVEQTCEKNNLSFAELVQPFCKLNNEAYIRDSTGGSVAVKNLCISVADVNSKPPLPTVARKFFNEAVSSAFNERTKLIQTGSLSLDIPVSAPWFEAWRETFFQVQFPSDHEFTKHYIACIVAVSSSERNVLASLNEMTQHLHTLQQAAAPNKPPPKWFYPSTAVLQSYLLLHDNTESDRTVAESAFESMKAMYGANRCFLLCINSQPPSLQEELHLPDPWTQFLTRRINYHDGAENEMVTGEMNHEQGSVETAQEAGEHAPVPVILHPLSPTVEHNSCAPHSNGHDRDRREHEGNGGWGGMRHGSCLTVGDVDSIRQFIADYTLNTLVPHVEVQIQILNDQISNKKGVSRSLLSATKRWFGGNKPGLPGAIRQPVNVMYSADTPELQLRRLGDLCFMFGLYVTAFAAYHAAKRDYGADGAWLHYAGALEMAALAAFMSPAGEPARKSSEYAEEAITTYLNSCRMSQFATRSTLLSVECLKGRGLYGEAAKQLIRMASEDSDLRSALLLEQAAYCFLAMPPSQTTPTPALVPLPLPMPRKYAFHLILAGHRFSKAGQRGHSLRCYRQGYQVYQEKQWSLAEDHIHYTIGRQAGHLKQTGAAAEAFTHLLTRASRQAASQQAAFLKEYLTVQQMLHNENSEVPTLPLPIVDGASIQLLLGAAPQPHSRAGVIPASGISFDTDSTDYKCWTKLEEQVVGAAAGLQPFVFKPTVELLTNQTNNAVCPTAIVGEAVSVRVALCNPLHIALPIGNLHLLWSYIPADGGLCQDNRLSPAPALSLPATTQTVVSLVIPPDSTHKVVLRVTPRVVGELRITGLAYSLADTGGGGSVLVEGRQPLVVMGVKQQGAGLSMDNRLRLSVQQQAPCLQVCFRGLLSEVLCGELMPLTIELSNSGSSPVHRVLLTSNLPHLLTTGAPSPHCTVLALPLTVPLLPQNSTQLPLWLRAPDQAGDTMLRLLFYYEAAQPNESRYRLVRHSWPFKVFSSVQIITSVSRSSAASGKNEEAVNIALQIRNSNQVHDPLMTEISPVQVSLTSPCWQLSPQAVAPEEVRLDSEECYHVWLRLRRCCAETGGDIISDLPLSSGEEMVPSLGTAPYVHLLPPPPSEPPPSMLVLRWKAEVSEAGGGSRSVWGQHHVQLARLEEAVPHALAHPPSTALRIFGGDDCSAPDTLNQRLVTYALQHPPTLHHNFVIRRLCLVRCKLVLQNCSDSQLSLHVMTLPSSTQSIPRAQLYSPRPSVCFRWVGHTQLQVSLSPHEAITLPLSAAMAAPGAYNLGSQLSISVSDPAGAVFPQSWYTDALIVVS